MTEREAEEHVDDALALLARYLAEGKITQEDYDADRAATFEWLAKAYHAGWVTGP